MIRIRLRFPGVATSAFQPTLAAAKEKSRAQEVTIVLMKRTFGLKYDVSLDFLEFVLDKGVLPFRILDKHLEHTMYTYSLLSAW